MNQFIEVTIMRERNLINVSIIRRIIERKAFCLIVADNGREYETAEDYQTIRAAITSLGGLPT